ncbi:MAG TPA: helix-turn-helix domain-containing protein [Bellilinea sp.]|nr:helix-turn-helix domain-containing protein [Bellilinea sp.]
MSIKRMSAVWDESKASGSTLLLLLAIADNASDDGLAWPGIETLAQRTRLSKRGVIKQLKAAEALGELRIYRRAGQHNYYVVDVGLTKDQRKAAAEVLSKKVGIPVEELTGVLYAPVNASSPGGERQFTSTGEQQDTTSGEPKYTRSISRTVNGNIREGGAAAESKQSPPADLPSLSSESPDQTQDLDLIGAWRDALPVKPLVTTYAGEASRLQELLIDDGITAADVRAYVAAQYDPDTSDGFWFGKSMSFKHVAGHVREWKIGEVLKKQAVKVAPSLPPADPDCPMCEGKGVYSYDVPYGDPRFGKTEVCACRKPGAQEAAA